MRRYNMAMRGTGLSANQIGVIAPYAKQKQKIRKLLEGKGLAGVTVGTTEVGRRARHKLLELSECFCSIR
jgi:hypothetical protein